MREGCLLCVRKHLAQASILMDESILGYPHHRWLAIGHLAEAESECIEHSILITNEIRKIRLQIMHNCENPKIEYLIIQVSKLAREDDQPSKESSKEFKQVI